VSRKKKQRRWGSYPLVQSPLYRLGSKRKLASVLGTDVKSLNRLTKQRENYVRFVINKGTVKEREIQYPKPWLNTIHHRIFDLLRRIEPPKYLKSGCKGESQITNAGAHLNSHRGFKFDIKRFYPSVKRTHVFSCFYKQFEMSPDVADLLSDVCTTDDALPTGSVLSGDLAFIANLPIFSKLAAIADEFAANITVYVDDITVTGELATREIYNRMISVVESHGFGCHKEVFFKPSGAKEITGVLILENEMLLPNRRHKKLHNRFIDLDGACTDEQFIQVARSVVGMMESADQIRPRYAVRKTALRREMAVIAGQH